METETQHYTPAEFARMRDHAISILTQSLDGYLGVNALDGDECFPLDMLAFGQSCQEAYDEINDQLETGTL